MTMPWTRIRNWVWVFLLLIFLVGFPLSSTADSGRVYARGFNKDCSLPSTDLTPLTDMDSTQDYRGIDGGLYGNGMDALPASHPHWPRAYQATLQVMPRDARGAIDLQNGKIGLISIGMSNARNEFEIFIEIAQFEKSAQVVLVNGAQAGKVASDWVDANPSEDPWDFLAEAVERAGLAPAQVQVVWLKQANARPRPGEDEFPVYARQLSDDMGIIVKIVKQRYPNTRLIYLSSRIFAGYSGSNPLNPEPFAYQSAFSVRWLIEDQIRGGGSSGVTYANAPVLLWGPYIWADGMQPRGDGLVWRCADFLEDGVHPGQPGKDKVAGMLLEFFTTDPLARLWFTHVQLTFVPVMQKVNHSLR